MTLLKLERTSEDLKYIMIHNRSIGEGYCWTKEKNVYTLGYKKVFGEGTIRIWGKDYKQKYIKINGKFIQYSRYQYEKYYGEIPEAHNVWYKDENKLNCSPENWYLVSDQNQSLERSIRHYTEELKGLLRLNNQLNREINNSNK